MRISKYIYYISRRLNSTCLASTFNKLHIGTSTKRDALLKKTGLFGLDQLQNPEGFHLLRDEALAKADSLVKEIIQEPKNKRNIVKLFDELSNCLCKVADLAEFIRVGHPQSRFRATAEQASVAISTLVEHLNTDRELYIALKEAEFDEEIDEHVAKLFLSDFEQCGIHLDDDKRKLVLHLNESILKLGSIFVANSNEPRLVNLDQVPKSIKHLFPINSGKAVISNLYADSSKELVREFAYRSYLNPNVTQNEILTNLLRCRLKLAQLCGFKSYAHRAVRGSIAGEPEVVKDFLNILGDRIKQPANKDYKQMLQMKIDATGDSSAILNAWDVPYYSAIYKKGIYGRSVQDSLPYFSVGVCMDGLNMIFNKLYGVRMQVDTQRPGEVWHNDVIKLNIIDDDNNESLGYIYCDIFERPTKLNQDCHHTIRGGCFLRDGTYQKPTVVLMLSIPETTDYDPPLLSPSMVDNLFHEMGHAMHSMLARTKYQHITGTRCSTDLAEVPSIMMELFASDPRVLSKFARHHSTGEPMPKELMERWIESKKVFTPSETQLQVFYAALDQAYHEPQLGTDEHRSSTLTTDILARTQAQYYPIPYVENTSWQLRFSHLVGYGAKYYSYLVSRAVACAIWRRLFSENPLSRRAGEIYKREVLSPGGGKPAIQIAEHVLNSRVDANFIAENVVASFDQTRRRADC